DSVKAQVETLTSRRWERLPTFDDLLNFSRSYDSLQADGLPAYDFLVYLRHHGFPSPLLDWTRSPYVSAFFAFRQARTSRVAIYVYQEAPRGFKATRAGEPQIKRVGQNVVAHPR